MNIVNSTIAAAKSLRGKGPDMTNEQALEMLAKVGYRYADMNFCSHTHEGLEMAAPDWEQWVQKQKDLADKLGLSLPQAHAHFFLLPPNNVIPDFDMEMLRRSIKAAKICGTKVMVFHPLSCVDDAWYSREKSKQFNVELFRRFGDECAKFDCKIALENLIERNDRTRRYCSSVEELTDLVDTLNAPERFGICWDFGHANLNHVDQCAGLRHVGKRLIAMHVNDNSGQKDDHVAPFFGDIEWLPIMKTLKEIGYAGDFTYEDFRFYNGLPEDLRESAMKLALEVARYLVKIYDEA